MVKSQACLDVEIQSDGDSLVEALVMRRIACVRPGQAQELPPRRWTGFNLGYGDTLIRITHRHTSTVNAYLLGCF